MRSIITILLTSLLAASSLHSQYGIVFLENVNYEVGIARAKEEGRPLMYYFHSDYCYDCSNLDSLFNTPEVQQYFNQNFLNIRIDYKQPIGDRLKKKFNIRYLPSVVLQNEEQGIVFILDQELQKEDLIQHGNWTLNPAKHGSEFLKALEKKRRMMNYERVEEIFDFAVVDNYVVEKENEITLYNQAQLHRLLNDGLAYEHFEKYLKTQEDWSTEKNMRFIFNFLDDTRSDAFKFLRANQDAFSNMFGKDTIDKFVNDLIYKRLYQLQPPPDYTETPALLQIRDPENSDMRTYQYLIDLKYKTNKIQEYLFLERKYIKKFDPRDHSRMIRMANVHLRMAEDNYNTQYYIDQAIIANKLDPNNIDYLYSLSRLYIKNHDKCGALQTAVRAYNLALKNEIDKLPGVLDSGL